MMKKILQITLIVMFLTVLIIPVVFINLKTQQISEIDNRYLSEFPKYNAQTFSSEFETYLTDRIGLRTDMIKFYTYANDKLFGVMTHPSYQYGKDGYVFSKSTTIPSREYVSYFSGFVKKMQDYCEDRDTEFLFWLNPNKISVYPEKMPDGVNFKYPQTEWLIEDFEKSGVNYYNMTETLVEAKGTIDSFNKKYDAGHWNDEGAFYGCSKLIDTLRKNNQSIVPLDKSFFTITREVKKTLPVSYFPINEEYLDYELNYNIQVNGDYTHALKLDESHSDFTYFINEQSPDAPTVLIFRGSYLASRRFQFINPCFSEVYLAQNYLNMADFDYCFNILKPDIVIFETAEYTVLPRYFPLEDFTGCDPNPVITTFDDTPESEFASAAGLGVHELRETAKNTESPIMSATYQITGSEISYAYMIIDGEIFDCKIEADDDANQTATITVKKEKFLNSSDISIILISKDQQQKSTKKLN